MAKIAFIQNILYEYLGPMYLSADLKKKGHEYEMFVLEEERNVINKLIKYKPDIIAFSLMSGFHIWSFEFAKKIKKSLNALLLFGGPHPTFFPEMIKNDFVDIICIGEGEEAIVDLANKIDKKQDITKIPNLWVKKGKNIYKNPVRPLIEDLSSLPFPDRELYYHKYKFLKLITTKRVMTGRGCPYNCSFCFNHRLKEMYSGKGRYVRKRNPEEVINEIKYLRKNYPLKTVRFVDDTFTLNHYWLFKFLDLYRREINLPFTCLCRANEVNEEVIIKLKEAGCRMVNFGIESGVERLRNKTLQKGLTDQQILDCATLLNKYKIKFGTYNIVGIPDETIEDAMETLNFNARIKAYNPMCTIFQPYGTRLTDILIEKGYLENFDINKIGTMFYNSKLKMRDEDKIQNLHKFFYMGVKLPWTIPIIKQLIKLPPNKVYDLIFFLSYGLRSFLSFRINFITALRLGYKLKSRLYSKKISQY